METVQIQLPSKLAERIRREMPTDEALSKFVAEAIQLRLEKQQEEKTDREKALHALRQAGFVMSAERQRSMAEDLLAKLSLPKTTNRAEVETALAKLKVPLSDEIISMRGDR